MALKVKAKPATTKPEARISKPEVRSSKGEAKSVRPRLPGRDIGVFRLVRDIRSELRKVVWPTRQEATNLTVIVIAVSAAVGVFLGGVDYVFRKIFEVLLAGF